LSTAGALTQVKARFGNGVEGQQAGGAPHDPDYQKTKRQQKLHPIPGREHFTVHMTLGCILVPHCQRFQTTSVTDLTSEVEDKNK